MDNGTASAASTSSTSESSIKQTPSSSSSCSSNESRNTTLDMSKLMNALDGKSVKDLQQFSVLRKTSSSSSAAGQKSQKLIQILPKTTIPLKTLQGPNGNIIVHGPHNKLVSLQLKQTNSPNAATTSTISLLPITIPKDAKSTNKVSSLALIGSQSHATTSKPPNSGKGVIITKTMLTQTTNNSNVSTKTKDATTVTVGKSTIVNSSPSNANNKTILNKSNTSSGNSIINTSSTTSLLSTTQSPSSSSLSTTPSSPTSSSLNSLFGLKSKSNSNSNSTMSTSSTITMTTGNMTSKSMLLAKTKEHSVTSTAINSVTSTIPTHVIVKGKDPLNNSTITGSNSTNSKSVLLSTKGKGIPSITTTITTSILTTTTTASTTCTTSSNSVIVSTLSNCSKIKSSVISDTVSTPTTLKNTDLCTKSLKDISIHRANSAASAAAAAVAAGINTPSNNSLEATRVSAEISLNKSSRPTTPTNKIISNKNLEIKPIIVSNSPKPLTPAQAATVPITSPPQISNTGFSFVDVMNTITNKTETANSPVIIEKRNGKHSITISTLKKDMIQKAANSSLISKVKTSGMATKRTQDIVPITKDTSVQTVNKEKELNDRRKSLSSENGDDSKSCGSNTSGSNDSTVIRVRSLDSLTQTNNNNNKMKIKQQSLLKNKTIEKLKRSPRTKGRSKSLTSIIGKNGRGKKNQNIVRRLSTCSENGVKKNFSTAISSKNNGKSKLSVYEGLLKAIKESTPPTPQPSIIPPTPKSDKSLLCDEKIDESPTNTSIPNSSNESLSSSRSSLQIFDNPTGGSVIKIEPESECILPDNSQSMSTLATESISSDDVNGKAIEILSLLNWRDGIGLSKDCKINFQLNEFGLIEIAENKFHLESNYDKPIFEREFKSQNTSDYSDPLYYCKGCNCQGAAVDFLAPDFCSRQCIQRYQYRSVNGLQYKGPRKYANRKREVEKMKLLPQQPVPVEIVQKKAFNWTHYLNIRKEEPAPIDLFPNPFPCGPNLFRIGMKLEAIDPEHSNLFCVCTIVDRRGYRIKLHFDGYSKKYDFWINADSMDIFPPGWCSKTNRTLQPPKGMDQLSFNWPMYLNKTKSAPAARNLFTHLNSSCTTNPFEVGMKLEADDLRNTRKVCVASVTDVLDNRILIHFDGWDESYDYWIDINSPYIHPVNWYKKNGFSIVPPPEWEDNFDWKTYITLTKCVPATEEMFSTRDPIAFRAGMKLEVVDKKNPSLIRPATVLMADEYEIKVLFDGWPEQYAFWVVDDSPDIHPVGWCEGTGHDLEPPLGFETSRIKMHCPFTGCRGIGNAKQSELDYHGNLDSCPYEPRNWIIEIDKSQRLEEQQEIISLIEEKLVPTKRRSEDIMNIPQFGKTPKLEINTITTESGSIIEMKKIDSRLNIPYQLLCDYGPRLNYVHGLWKKNSECLIKNLGGPIVKNPLEWTPDEVSDYIRHLLGCDVTSEEFQKQEIDGAALLAMRQSDLTDILNLKLGPAIKIYNQIVQLREEVVVNFSSSLSLT